MNFQRGLAALLEPSARPPRCSPLLACTRLPGARPQPSGLAVTPGFPCAGLRRLRSALQQSWRLLPPGQAASQAPLPLAARPAALPGALRCSRAVPSPPRRCRFSSAG